MAKAPKTPKGPTYVIVKTVNGDAFFWGTDKDGPFWVNKSQFATRYPTLKDAEGVVQLKGGTPLQEQMIPIYLDNLARAKALDKAKAAPKPVVVPEALGQFEPLIEQACEDMFVDRQRRLYKTMDVNDKDMLVSNPRGGYQLAHMLKLALNVARIERAACVSVLTQMGVHETTIQTFIKHMNEHRGPCAAREE